MKIGEIFPSKEEVDQIKNVELLLLSRKNKGKIAGWTSLFAALAQLGYILWPYINKLGTYNTKEYFETYFKDPWKVILFLVLVSALLIYLLLRRTSILIRETKEPFRYTFTVQPFKLVGKEQDTKESSALPQFVLKDKNRLQFLMHHDLTELINQRIKRFSVIPYSEPVAAAPNATDDKALVDTRKSSHIEVFGHYAIREDSENEEWVIHFMPFVRLGQTDSSATLAQSIRFPLSTDESPDILNTYEYNQLLEQVYSRVTTEIYAQIEKDIRNKIDLFPTRYLRANALFYEARDMANSNTINAFDSAISLYNEAIHFLSLSITPKMAFLFIRMPFLRLIFARHLFQYARINIGLAKCLIYKYRIATLSGRIKNPLYEIRQNLKQIIRNLNSFYSSIATSSEIAAYRNKSKTFGVLAFLTYPPDSFLRKVLFKPSRRLFTETRTLLFNAFVVQSLTDTLVEAYVSAREMLEKAKAIAPDLSKSDPLYFLAMAYSEPNTEKKILLLKKVIELAPTFQIAQFDLAFRLEMDFRKNNEIRYNRAKSVLAEYDRVLRINPGNIAALAAQGYIYWILRDFEKAKRKFREGYEIKNLVSETFVGQLIYGNARILAEEGRINECYDCFTQAVAINPNVGSYCGGDDTFFPGSFYEFISGELLARYKTYYEIYDNFVKTKKFLFGCINNEFTSNLDKCELTDGFVKALKKINVILPEKKSFIVVKELSKHWIINAGEQSESIYIDITDGNFLSVYSTPDVSSKISNGVYSFILNDYASANFNFYRRNGENTYLLKAIELYSSAIENLPENIAAKYNKSVAILEHNKVEEAIDLLNGVLEKRPTWFEALSSSVTLNLNIPEKIGKLRKELDLQHEELVKLESDNNSTDEKIETPTAASNVPGNNASIQQKSGQTSTGTGSIRNKIKDINYEITRLIKKSEELQSVINEFLSTTMLFPLYDGKLLKSGDYINLDSLIRKRNIKWTRLNESDVHALKLYSSYYHTIPDSNLKADVNRILFDIVLNYFNPEDIEINMEVNIDRAVPVASIESNLFYRLAQDPANFHNYRLFQNKIEQLYSKCLQNILRYPEPAYAKFVNQESNAAISSGKLENLLRLIENTELFPNDRRWKAYAYNMVGDALIFYKDYPSAIKAINMAIGYNSFIPVYYNNLGNAYAGLTQWDESICQYKEAIALRKSILNDIYELDFYYGNMAVAYLNCNKLNEFLTDMEKSGDLNDKPEKKAVVFNRIGIHYYSSNAYPDADVYYRKALDLNPERAIYWCNLGRNSAATGKWQEAADFYNQAIEKNKISPEELYDLDYYYEFLSEASFNTGKLDEFLAIFEKSGDLNDKPEKKAIVFNRMGNLHFTPGKYGDATFYYKLAIKLDPQRPIYYCNLGRAFTNLNMLNEALETLKVGVELRKKAVDDSYGLDYYYKFLGEAYIVGGNKDEFFNALERSGDLNDSRENKAAVYNYLANLINDDSAVHYYQKAIELDSAKPIYYSNLGIAYTKSEQYANAIASLEESVKLRKSINDETYGLNYFYDFLSEAYYNAGKIDQFLEKFEKSGDLSDEPYKKALVFNRVANLFYASQNQSQAITYYNRSLELNPNRPIYWSNLALAQTKAGDLQQAEKNYKNAIDLQRKWPEEQYDFDYYYEFLAEVSFKLGKLNEFVGSLEESADLLEKPGKKAMVYNRIGNLLLDANESKTAIAYYLKAVDLDPERAIYVSNLGIAYANGGRWKNAITFQQQALDIWKVHPDDQAGIEYYYGYLAEAYFKAKKINHFLEVFEKTDDMNSRPVQKAIIFNKIGNLYFEEGNYTEAIPCYTKAFELDNTRPIYMSNAGQAYSNLNQWDEAYSYFTKAVELKKEITTDDGFNLDYYTSFLNQASSNLESKV